MLKEIFINFSDNTTIHGFSYIVQPSRYRTERVFWILSVLISFILISLLIYRLLSDSKKVPIIIYIDENYVSVEELDFPAVSVCYGFQFQKPCFTLDYYDEFVRKIKGNESRIDNYSLDELKNFQILSLLQKDQFMLENFPDLQIPTNDFIDRIQKLNDTIPLNQVNGEGTLFNWNSFGQWIGQYLVHGKRVLSDTGVCFGYNFPEQNKVFNTPT